MEREFERLYEQNYRRLYTMAFRLTGNREDTEDVLQNAFLNAYKSWGSFRGESSHFTWLYRITLHTAQRSMKKERRLHVTTYAEEHQLTERDVYGVINQAGYCDDDYLVERVRQSCLQMFMNCMPRRYRTVYALRCILGFSVAETAEIMEISPEAVKVYLHRSRKISRDHFEGRCSLIHPGAPCNCRAFAAYLKASGKTGLLLNLEAAAEEEKEAAETFRREVAEVREIQRLYETRILPEPFPDFLEKIRNLMKQESFRLLDA